MGYFPNTECPKCKSHKLRKNGTDINAKAQPLQSWRCLNCGHPFRTLKEK